MVKRDLKASDLGSRLCDEFGYPKEGAQLVANQLLSATPDVRKAFLRWWRTGDLDSALEIEGYTAPRLMKEHGMNPVAAFLTLDWLAREPQAASESLAHGHDRVAT